MMEKTLSEGLHKNSNRLSVCGKIISFTTTRENERSESLLLFCSSSFERERNAFLKAADGAAVISRKRSARVHVVRCKCVVDVQRKHTTSFVLVTKKSEKTESFLYSLLSLGSSNRLEPCVEFKLQYEMRGTVSILQGPTVLWSHAGSVFYTSLQAGEVRQIPFQLSHPVFGELPLPKAQVFILGLQNTSDNQSTSQTLGYFLESGQMFDGSMILPHPYICVTRCILVLSADRVQGVLKSAVVAATSARQLVYFENGIVKDMCQVPFEHPEDIQVVSTGRNGVLFVVSFQQGHVCAIWKETFQIASRWSGVSSVHVDDFLGCGTDQMLLIFEDESVPGQPPDRFLITDLCGISYSRGLDSGPAKSSPPPPENYLFTLQALESRLQSGLTLLQELEREVRVKERVLQQSVQALTDVVSERKTVLTQHEEEGLIALWDCDDESKDEASDDKTQDMPAVSSKPRVDKLWHRVAEDRMVVGVILTTDSSVPVAGVSLSILTETGQSSTLAVIQTRSQVFWLPTPSPSSSSSSSPSSSSSCSSASTFLEPAAKRSKQHHTGRPNDLNTCRLAVTAVAGLTPLLNSGGVKCRVMLHYVQRQQALPLVSSPTPAVLHCGEVVLDIHTDFQTRLLKNHKLKTDEVQEDLLSLLAVLDRWVFHIDSPEHSLGDIDGWMHKKVGCMRVEVSPRYLMLNSSGTSAPVLLHWNQRTPFQGELCVHSSQLPMLQFLDSLLAFLPASCSVRSAKRTRGQGAAQIFSLALERELASLRECVSVLLGGEQEGEGRGWRSSSSSSSPGHETPKLGSADGLQRCREVWQQDVERSRSRLSPLVDVGKYRRLTQSLSEVQLDGDLAALLETQRTLLC